MKPNYKKKKNNLPKQDKLLQVMKQVMKHFYQIPNKMIIN